MERKQKIIQVYAVIICVVTVITIIISTSSLVSALIDKNNPLYSGRNDVSLSSVENFKMDALKSSQADQGFIPDEETFVKMYESAKTAKIKSVQHRSYQSIVVSSLIISISLLLFGSHWILMRKMAKSDV